MRQYKKPTTVGISEFPDSWNVSKGLENNTNKEKEKLN